MSENESTRAPSPTTTHPPHPSATFVPIAASLGVEALVPVTSHSAQALVTSMASSDSSDATRDESIGLFQSDSATEDARNDLDLGSTDDEDVAFEQLDPKKGKLQGADLDLEEEDHAPMALPMCFSSFAPPEVAEVVAGALESAAFPKVACPKVRIKVSSIKPVEAASEEMHLGFGLSTEEKEGTPDIITLPKSQVCIQSMREITTATEDCKKKFCSKPDGDLILEASSKGADMFNGGKPQKKRALDSDGAGTSGTSTKSKASSTGGKGGGRGRPRGRTRLPSTAYRPMLHQMAKLPPGFI